MSDAALGWVTILVLLFIGALIAIVALVSRSRQLQKWAADDTAGNHKDRRPRGGHGGGGCGGGGCSGGGCRGGGDTLTQAEAKAGSRIRRSDARFKKFYLQMDSLPRSWHT